MNWIRTVKIAAALALLAGPAARAAADVAAPRLIVSYLEASSAKTGALARSLQAYAAQIRQSAGRPSVLVLHELGRPNRMLVIEHWPALKVASDAATGQTLRTLTQGELQAPIDRRLNDPIAPLIAQPAPPKAFQVAMHVDVVPPGAAFAVKLLTAQRTAALTTPGNLGFEVGVQPDRVNHFALHEVWTSRAAYEAYTASPAAKAFRDQLATVKGALFDDRYYAANP